jgi:hypothetical protein
MEFREPLDMGSHEMVNEERDDDDEYQTCPSPNPEHWSPFADRGRVKGWSRTSVTISTCRLANSGALGSRVVCEGIRPLFFGLFLTARILIILISRSQALSNIRARLGGPRLPGLRKLRIGRSASGPVGPGVTGSADAATSWPMAGYSSGIGPSSDIPLQRGFD